jgi:hypothetical protein
MMSERNRVKPLMVELSPIECEMDAAAHCFVGFILNHPEILKDDELEWIATHDLEKYTDFYNATVKLNKNRSVLVAYYTKMVSAIDLYYNERYL